ncbi:MAG: YabP/YqfC family sporulation protein [Lachnospiraceae bacterium]
MKNNKINETNQRITLKEKMCDSMKLPKDIMLGASIVTVIGERELWVENYKGILDYTDKKIVLQGKQKKIIIMGSYLKIEYYTKEEMKISGKIEDINFV